MSELNSKNADYLSEEKVINKDKKLKINIKKNIIRRNNIHTGFGHQ